VAGFVGFGFVIADEPLRPPFGLEPVIAYGAVGVGEASCVLVGLFIVGKVRARRMPRFLAAVLLLWSSFLSIFVPVPIMYAAARATPYRGSERGFHLFQGEHAMGVLVVYYGFWIAVATFVVFTVCVFSVGRSKRQKHRCA